MMIESLNADLDCHRGSPDKTPERRLATLEAAGELAIPFTTGILVGIGETAPTASPPWTPSPTAHARHGHVQEVIVQNFLPKAGTAMHSAPPCPPDEYLDAIALARLHPAGRRPPAGAAQPDRRLRRAARRRHRRLGRRLPGDRRPRQSRAAVAGPRPPARRHRSHGLHALAPRLTIYPEFVARPRTLARRPRSLPGARPQRRRGPRPRRSRARCSRRTSARSATWATAPRSCRSAPLDRVVLGRRRRRRTTLMPGAPSVAPVRRSPRCSTASGSARSPASTSSSRCSRPAGPRSRRSPSSPTSCDRPAVGDVVTFVRNRNINYTNVCTFKCRFCGFSKGPLSLNLRGTPYLLTLDDIAERVQRGVGHRGDRGVPAGRDPSRLRRRLLHRRGPGREGGGARHARARLHRARGHRGRPPPRRAARRRTCGG